MVACLLGLMTAGRAEAGSMPGLLGYEVPMASDEHRGETQDTVWAADESIGEALETAEAGRRTRVVADDDEEDVALARVVVDEYVPAPGQFVNALPAYDEGDTADDMARKCTEALAEGHVITLGAWGGYVTFHLEQPVANVAGRLDLCLLGNAHVGASEPGIVQVSVDANGNGRPDDPWYELAGSADVDSAGVRYGHRVTYVRPVDPTGDIAWTDDAGGSGWVYRNPYNVQDYYPRWLGSPLTLSGTLLPPNGHDTSGRGTYWVLDAYRYGYVDNVPNADTLGCSFDLGWAVDPLTREAVTIERADFVRIYCGVQQVCGWIGETSTEFSGARSLHPELDLGLADVVADRPVAPAGGLRDLLGRRCAPGLRGIMVGADGRLVVTGLRR